MSEPEGKVEIGGKLIDRDLIFKYLKVQFADMGATGIYEPEERDQIEAKWGGIEEYREQLHDEIYRQAGFASYDEEHPSRLPAMRD